MERLAIPDAPMSIKKGFALKQILGREAVRQLACNLHFSWDGFDKTAFEKEACTGLDSLELKQRSAHLADAMRRSLPALYEDALEVLVNSLTPALDRTEGNGLSGLFYMPHIEFIGRYGLDADGNGGRDPFDLSMEAQFELTKRFTCEFSIRPFLAAQEVRTLDVLDVWSRDADPHVRRLCSEGTRPRLPWATKLDSFVEDPSPCIPMLQRLKDDPDLYVRRSVANHVGDIAKDHLELAIDLCEGWLDEAGGPENATEELKWVVRHAMRNPVKKGVERALRLSYAAGRRSGRGPRPGALGSSPTKARPSPRA
jgi:3-methyladenine DNA glycosylase AlkC